MAEKDQRGFAGMDKDEQRKIASKGGKASHEHGASHETKRSQASEAGRKGGEPSRARESHGSESESHTSHHAPRRAESHESGHSQGHEASGAYGEKARAFIGKEVKHHVDDKGMPQDQAVASAMDEARRKGYKVPEKK